MAVHRVKEPREGQAEDGAQEEQAEDHLLLHRGDERHVGPEHVEDAKTDEEDAACNERKRSTDRRDPQGHRDFCNPLQGLGPSARLQE